MKHLSSISRAFVFCFLLISCRYEDIYYGKSIEEYDPQYMFFIGGYLPSPANPKVKLTYNHQVEVIRRSGCVLFNGDNSFYNDFYEEVTYLPNHTIIELGTDLQGTYEHNRKDIFYEGNQISKMIRTRNRPGAEQRDTILFSYHPSGNLLSTIERQWLEYTGQFALIGTFSKIYFFESGNLAKIEGENLYGAGLKLSILETFENFDNAPNPLKRMIIFDDIFYRALSKNNFTTYTYKETDENGRAITSRSVKEFNYNENGIPTYK